MSMLSRRAIVLVAIVAIVVVPLLDFVPLIRGGLPIVHILTPYGFVERDIPDLNGKAFLITGANVR